MNDDLNVFKLF